MLHRIRQGGRLWRRERPEIHIAAFEFLGIPLFNQCENSNGILIAIGSRKNLRLLLKTIPADWGYAVPFGLFSAPAPSAAVKRFLAAVKAEYEL